MNVVSNITNYSCKTICHVISCNLQWIYLVVGLGAIALQPSEVCAQNYYYQQSNYQALDSVVYLEPEVSLSKAIIDVFRGMVFMLGAVLAVTFGMLTMMNIFHGCLLAPCFLPFTAPCTIVGIQMMSFASWIILCTSVKRIKNLHKESYLIQPDCVM